MSKNNEFVWIGILFAVGWLSVLIAQLLLPFLSNISARRSFIIFEMTEATLFLLFPLLVFSGLVLYFIILTFIVGILDEVGKGTLPPIFKAISENNLKHNVSFFRSWNMVARILGIVASGIAYRIHHKEFSDINYQNNVKNAIEYLKSSENRKIFENFATPEFM